MSNNIKRIKIFFILFSAIAAVLITVLVLCFQKQLFSAFHEGVVAPIYDNYTAPSTNISSKWSQSADAEPVGDIYVSTDGDDDGDGTAIDPFLTIERAIDAVKSMDKSGKTGVTVCIKAGEYNVSSLVFERGLADCPITYCAIGGEVVINGGVTLSSCDFSPVTDYPEISERLSDKAKSNVVVIDLKQEPYSLTSEQFGNMYPIGTYNTAQRYGDDTPKYMHSELFINGKRQELARYPDADYIYTDGVIVSGKDNPVADENGDPSPDVYKVSQELANRISKWKNIKDVWVYGFWMHDWADGSSPLKDFNSSANQLSIKYQSFFGARAGAPYYFYNCLEELSCEGEWYLDRETGLLCIYAPENMENADITLSLSTSPVIQINADNITLDRFTVKGARSDGIVIYGNNNCIRRCTVTDLAGEGIRVSGSQNKILQNEISGTGRGGISVTGGDKITLTKANNVVDNNLIHDWSEIFKTYQAGINVGGVGNICSHNELYNAPHLAITYDGNNHIFEYNLIHDVCLQVSDAGAIYAGRSWTSYGNHIRYNCIYNIGTEGYASDGIYMDDAISGQSIYGNLLINIPKYAIFIGGGRDMNVFDNVIINAGGCAIRYDIRAREGVLKKTWFSEHVEEGKGDLWLGLYSSPWKSEIWQEAFPEYKSMTDDFSLINDKRFVPNPANSTIISNVIFDKRNSIGKIDEAVTEFSRVEDNAVFSLHGMLDCFESVEKGDYNIKDGCDIYSQLPDFEPIPIEKIGRK